jgi:hypothetical protein
MMCHTVSLTSWTRAGAVGARDPASYGAEDRADDAEDQRVDGSPLVLAHLEAEELHLSIKTVEPLVSAIFVKLGLHPDADNNRRVLAVLAFLRR